MLMNTTFLGDSFSIKWQSRVDAQGGAAFALYPTSMEELFRAADQGRLMPPKSTWFEPKLRSGLFLHMIS